MEHESYRNFLGAIMKAARLRKGLSQDELADKAGMTVRHITSVENGHQETLLSNVIILSKAMGESAGTLVTQLEYALENGVLPDEVASILPPKKRGRPVTNKEPVSTGPKRRPGRPRKKSLSGDS